MHCPQQTMSAAAIHLSLSVPCGSIGRMPSHSHWLRRKIESLLGVQPDAKPGIYMQVYEASEIFSLNYNLELYLSAGIAILGLVLDSPAVVIGAMLVSPLMGPILGGGMALATSDIYLGIKSLISVTISVAGAIGISALVVWLMPFHSPTTEILARTHPNLLDLGVALLSGVAGSVVVARGSGGGGVTALPGVAIAVALMPPLCTVGFGVGAGFNWEIISGAGLLFLTNLVAIVTAAFLVFYATRMDAPDVRAKLRYSILERISRERLFRFLKGAGLEERIGAIGELRGRLFMLLALLAILFVPLQRSLYQLRDEIGVRSAVREVLTTSLPPGSILSQQLELTSTQVAVQMITTASLGSGKVEEIERELIRRTGKQAELSIRQIASREELALLSERLRPQPVPPPPPAPAKLSEIQTELLARIDGPLKQVWPNEVAPLQGYELAFAPEEILLRIRYQAPRALDAAAAETLTKALSASLDIPTLRLDLVHQRPSRTPARR